MKKPLFKVPKYTVCWAIMQNLTRTVTITLVTKWNQLQNELYESHFPYDLSSGTSLIFVYIDIIQYQIVGGAKAPMLRVIDSNRRIKNGSDCSINLIIEKTSLILASKNYSVHLYNQYPYNCAQKLATRTLCTIWWSNVDSKFQGLWLKTNGTVICKASFTSWFLWTLPTTLWRFGFWYWSCCYAVCTTGCPIGCQKKIGKELWWEQRMN